MDEHRKPMSAFDPAYLKQGQPSLTPEDEALLNELEKVEGPANAEAEPKVLAAYGGGKSNGWNYEAKHEHRGAQVAKGLLASSVRGGLSTERGAVVRVLLTSELLGLVVKPSTSSVEIEGFETMVSEGCWVYWPWTDMSTPEGNLKNMTRIAALHKMHKSGWTIEVACFGGHGRTGTLLAILAALAENWPASDAVRNLRAAYCERAVETRGQEKWVEKAIVAVRYLLAGQQAVPFTVEPEPEPQLERFEARGYRYPPEWDPNKQPSRNLYIRELRDRGYTLKEIGRAVNLSFQRVSEILMGKGGR